MTRERIREIFNSLIGTWQLERTATPEGTFKGKSIFTPVGENRLSYREEGESWVAGQHARFYREYVYELHDDKIVIYYNDPHRPKDILHELAFREDDGSLRAEHCHVCAQDCYDIEFRVGKDRLDVNYRVKGPKKDYTLHSVLTREPQ